MKPRTRWTPPSPLVWRDQRARAAGEDYRLCSEGAQKLLAVATGHSTTRVSQEVRGDHTGAGARFYELLDRLAGMARRSPKINPGAPIAGALVHLGNALTSWVDADLVRWVRQCLRWETVTEARENVDAFDLAAILDRLEELPQGAAAEELIEIVQRYRRDAIREIGWQVSAVVAARELERRLEREVLR